MKILIDENIPRKLRRFFTGHSVFTVVEMGWKSIKNGMLLEFAEKNHFDVFVTVDKGIQHQNRISGRQIILATFIVPKNKAEFIRPKIPDLLDRLNTATPGQIINIT